MAALFRRRSLAAILLTLPPCLLFAPHPQFVAFRSVPRRTRPISATADAARATAEWAVNAGRAEAAVAVSGAATTAEAMRDIWKFASEVGKREEAAAYVLALPAWAEATQQPRFLSACLQHLMACGEVCEYMGESLQVSAKHPSGASDDEPAPPFPVLLLRSYKSSGYGSADSDYFDANYVDPYADLDDEVAAPQATAEVSDEEVKAVTYKWVDAVIVKMKVCPFSSDVERAGLPAGVVSYPINRATIAEDIYAAFWEQVVELSITEERELSTVLLVTPDFAMYSAGGFDLFADSLNAALTDLKLESQIQLVFFHPEYTFRDGKQRLGGEGGAANFARRSPYPMINLLRTPQVRAAQKGIPTGSVYETNERNLASVGTDALQEMLRKEDWAPIDGRIFEPHV